MLIFQVTTKCITIITIECGIHLQSKAKKNIYLLISGIDRGDVVSVYCDLESKCRKGLIKPFDGRKVFLGNGIAALARKEIFCSEQNIRCVNMTLASLGRGNPF